MQIQSRALVSMISVCLSFFDDRSTIVKRLKGIATGHFYKGVSSNQYWVLCQALINALMTCLGCTKENPSIIAWNKIFAYFLSVIVPFAKSLEATRNLTNVFKSVCGDYESKRLEDVKRGSQPPVPVNKSAAPSVQVQDDHHDLHQESKADNGNQLASSPTSTSACPYQFGRNKRDSYKAEFSLNTIDIDVTVATRKDRVGSLVLDRDLREDEPSNTCPMLFQEL